MTVFMFNQKCKNLMAIGIHAVRVTFADAVLCAVCGALYGMVFGGFGAQVRHDFSGMYAFTGSCATVGFAIGVAIGAFHEVTRLRNLHRAAPRMAARDSTRGGVQMTENSMRGLPTNPLFVGTSKSPPRVTALGG